MLDYLSEIESDLSAWHRYRVDSTTDGGWACGAGDWDGLSSRRFFLLAERLPGYEGVLRTLLVSQEQARLERENGSGRTDETLTTGGTRIPDGGGGSLQVLPNGDTVRTVPLTREMVATGASHLEGLDGLIEVRRVTPQ